jgi:hypothetical protein
LGFHRGSGEDFKNDDRKSVGDLDIFGQNALVIMKEERKKVQ